MVDEHPSPGGAASIWFVDGFFDGFARRFLRSPQKGAASLGEGGNSLSKGRFVTVFAKSQKRTPKRITLDRGFAVDVVILLKLILVIELRNKAGLIGCPPQWRTEQSDLTPRSK